MTSALLKQSRSKAAVSNAKKLAPDALIGNGKWHAGDSGSTVFGDIDTTYHTQQRDMFTSGLAGEIGVNAFAVWHAIKSHADFNTGIAWPGIRRLMELTGLSTNPVQAAIKKLVATHLLRITKRGQKNVYIARERMDVRVGGRVICTIAIDFVPSTMRERLARLKGSAAGGTRCS